MLRVEDVMTHNPECCSPEDDLATVANVMWDLDIGCVPVIGDGHHIAGMITDRDICMGAMLAGKALHELRVETVMAKEIVTARVGDRLRTVQELMRKSKVRRLPVVDGDRKVVGVVSLHDLARAAKRDKRRLFPDVRMKDVALTFAEISEPTPKPALPERAPADHVAYAE
jgi:CBS domain-containing protein